MRIGEFNNVNGGDKFTNISGVTLMGAISPGDEITIYSPYRFYMSDASLIYDITYSSFTKANFRQQRKPRTAKTKPEVLDINVQDLAKSIGNITDEDLDELIMNTKEENPRQHIKDYQLQASKEQIDFIDKVTAKYPVFSTHEVPADNILLNDMRDTFSECLTTAIAKNSDYGGFSKDPFANFKNSTIVNVPVEKGIMVRMMDKVSRITTLLDKEAKVKDESIQDTLMDLINYTAILKSYLKNKSLSHEG